LRPGRLDLVVCMGAPDQKDRLEILKVLTPSMPLATDVNLEEVSQSSKGFSGADLTGLCREAAVNAMRKKSDIITANDFANALHLTKPSITKDVEDWYELMTKKVTYAMPKALDRLFYG
jgi:transitional endoplasmic reticulum ATPase